MATKKDNNISASSSAKETKGTQVPEASLQAASEVKTEGQKKQAASEAKTEGQKEQEAVSATVSVKVVREFLDKYDTSVRHKPGDVLDVDKARACDLITRELAVKL